MPTAEPEHHQFDSSGREVAAEWVARLVDARNTVGVTQAMLAAAVGVGLPALRAWEAGRRIPTLSHLISLGNELGLHLTVLDADRRPVMVTLVPKAHEQWDQREIRRIVSTLRTVRRAVRWSQERLASEIEATASSLVRFENAELHPRPAVLARWARALGCAVIWSHTPRFDA